MMREEALNHFKLETGVIARDLSGKWMAAWHASSGVPSI
jgi:hypothetical protein